MIADKRFTNNVNFRCKNDRIGFYSFYAFIFPESKPGEACTAATAYLLSVIGKIGKLQFCLAQLKKRLS